MKMKKFLALLCCLTMIFSMGIFMTSCGKDEEGQATETELEEATLNDLYGDGDLSDSKYVGDWEYVNTAQQKFALVLKADGTAKVTVIGIESEGEWVEWEDGKQARIGSADFEDIYAEFDGDKLTFEFGDEIIKLEKQK